MDEKQLQLLFESFGKNQGFKDYTEFKSLLSDSSNRKLYFDQSNKDMKFSDYNEFEDLLGFKKKDQSEKSVGSPASPSSSPSPSKFSLDFKEFIRKPQVGDNTLAPRPAQMAQLEEDVRTAPERKAKQQADLQTAIANTTKKALQKKGINAVENSPIFNEEKKKIAKAVENGDAVFVSPNGEPGLKRTIGWWESLAEGWNEATQASEDAVTFANVMSTEERVNYVKKLEQAKASESPYVGEKPTAMGYVGKFVGENAPFIGKVVAGSMAGAAAVAAAPESLGASLTALPTIGAFMFSTPDMAYQHAMGETIRRYQLIRKEKPQLSEVEAMKEAESGLPVGAAQGVLTNALLMGTKLKIGKDETNAIANAVKKNLESSTHMALGATGSKIATDVVSAAQGYGNPNAVEEIVTTFKDNMSVGLLLNGLTQAAHGVISLPKNVSSAFKYGLKNVPSETIKSELQANVEAGNVDAETANRVYNDIQEFKTASGKVAPGLSAESESAVTGLLQKRYKLETESKTKDETAQDYYKQQIDALNGQIKKIIETNDPYTHEVNELSGETYSETVKPVEDTRPKTAEEAMSRFTPEQKQQYIDLVVEGKDAEADAMLDLAPEPPVTVKKESISTLDETQYEGVQSKVVKDVKNVVSAVSDFVGETTGNELSVNLHKNEKSFGEAVVNAGGTKQDASSKGFYLAKDGSIHLNMSRVTPETMLHEGFHPILDFVERTRPESINELYTQLESIKGSMEVTEKAKNLYSGETTQKKEAITDFVANVANGTYKIDASNFEVIKNYFLELFKKLGFDVETQKIFDLKDAKELKDLAQLVGEKFQKGEQIKTSEVSKGKLFEKETEGIQFAKGDELKPEETDYRIAEKVVREDKKDFKRYPEAVIPDVQRGKDGKIKLEVIEGENGERIVKPLYSGISYELKNGAQKYIAKDIDKAVEKLSDRLRDDYIANKDRPEIAAAIGWYGKMRQWFQKNFGANIEMFGQLLAATSARTEVIDNFKQAVDAMRNLAKGKYDELLKDYDAFVKDIQGRSDEVLFDQWKERYPNKRPSEFNADAFRRLLINGYENVPLRSNGKKFNANSKKVLQALYGNWIEQTEGPKTKNFAGNLTGRSFDATIDVWAARYLRRVIYGDKVKQWRILPQSEGGVQYTTTKSGMSGDYPFAEAVMRRAAEKVGIKADDLQAFLWYLEKDVWDKNEWTNLTGKRKASFEEGASTLNTERYQAGITTYKDDATFDPVKFENERQALQKEVANVEGVIASRITPSDGEFYSSDGIYREPTFDVEFTVEKGADISKLVDKISEIQTKYNQDAILISKFVDPSAENARPIIEVGLSKPIEKSEIVDDIKQMLADMDVRGFTTSRDSQGRILGIRSQFVPEFEKGVSIDAGVERFVKAFEAIKNKYQENAEISYITSGSVDTQVKFKSDGKEAKQNDGTGNAERGVQNELRGEQPGQGQGDGNRIEGEEGGRRADGRGYGEDDGMGQQPKDGSVEPQFSKQERAAKIEDLYRKKLLSEDEFNAAMAKIDKLYPNPTGVKNAIVDEERIARGLEPLEKMMSESFGTWYDQAKTSVDLGYVDPKKLARNVASNPRALMPEETAALTYGRMQLMNDRTQTINNLEKAISSGDEQVVNDLKFKLAEIEQDIDFNDNAANLSGTLQGRALVARKMMLADDYSLTNVERRMKIANGGKSLPAEVIKKIEVLDQELKQAQLKLQEYEQRSQKMQVNEVIAQLRAKQPKVSGKQDSQRAAILQRVRERMNKNKPEFSREERVNPLEEFLSDIGELSRSYVEEGVTDPVELVERVHADFLEVFPELEIRDVQDAISGYGKRTFLSQEETTKQLREIKAQLRLFSALEDVEGGKLPEKSGLQRDEPSDEVRQLRQKLNEAIKESGLNEISKDAETKYKTALDAAKKRLVNQIVDLENQIETGERKAPRKGIEYDQEAIELRNERDRLKGIIEEIDGKQGMTEEQKIRVATAAVERSIADLERRIIEKDFSKTEDKPISTPELEMLRDQQKKLRSEYEALKESEGVTEAEKLKRYKKSLEKRKADYEDKIARGDFAKKEVKKTVLDEEAMKLKKEVEDVKFKFDREKIKLEEQNKSKTDKAIEKFLKVRREILLSSVVTLGKIATAGSYIVAAKPLESAAGSVLNKIPGVREIAQKAPREGAGFSAKAEAKAITEILKASTLTDMGRIMKGQKSVIETAYGKKVLSAEEHSFFGNLHALLKSVPKKGEIYRSIEYRLESARKNGENITDPVVTSRIISEAIIDGNREIFMGDNKIVDGYRRFVNALEKGENLGTKIPKVVLDFLFPIIKVPTNYVKSTGEYLAGTASAVTKLASKGMKDLTPQEADLVMRLMKKNLIGAGFFMLGYFNSKNVGGYYTGKREEDDLKAMDLNILGIEIPHWATHHPLIEVMQFGSTVRRLNDNQEKQGEDATVAANTAKAGAKLVEEVPFLSTTGDVIGAMESDYKATNFAGTLAGSLLVPPDVYRIAKMQDTKDGEVTKRRTTTVMEKVQERVPYLRQQLPEDPKAKKTAAREKIRDIMEEKGLRSLRPIRRDNPELYEAADIKDEVRFIQSTQLDKEVFRFSEMSSAKQIKRWSALSEDEKQKYRKFINSRQSFQEAVKEYPELLKEARWKKAYEQLIGR